MTIPRSLSQATLLLILSIILVAQIACSKKSDMPANNNELRATVKFTSPMVLNYSVTGSMVTMGCDIWGISSWIQSTDETNGRIALSMYGPCISAPGTTGKIVLQYLRYPNSQTSPVYYNTILRTPGGVAETSGSITITAVNGDQWEGSFEGVCWSPANYADSVVIKGTFKGKKQ